MRDNSESDSATKSEKGKKIMLLLLSLDSKLKGESKAENVPKRWEFSVNLPKIE